MTWNVVLNTAVSPTRYAPSAAAERRARGAARSARGSRLPLPGPDRPAQGVSSRRRLHAEDPLHFAARLACAGALRSAAGRLQPGQSSYSASPAAATPRLLLPRPPATALPWPSPGARKSDMRMKSFQPRLVLSPALLSAANRPYESLCTCARGRLFEPSPEHWRHRALAATSPGDSHASPLSIACCTWPSTQTRQTLRLPLVGFPASSPACTPHSGRGRHPCLPAITLAPALPRARARAAAASAAPGAPPPPGSPPPAGRGTSRCARWAPPCRCPCSPGRPRGSRCCSPWTGTRSAAAGSRLAQRAQRAGGKQAGESGGLSVPPDQGPKPRAGSAAAEPASEGCAQRHACPQQQPADPQELHLRA